MKSDWRSHVPQLEELARKLGLDWSPVLFEAVPDSFMTEIAVYGLPVRMPHWSFGARYIYQLLQRHMGYSRLFEGAPRQSRSCVSRLEQRSRRQCTGDGPRAGSCRLLPRTTSCSAAVKSR